MINVLVIGFFILERPPSFEDEIIFFRGEREFFLGIKFKGQIIRKDIFPEEIGLLVGELIRIRNGLREGDSD